MKLREMATKRESLWAAYRFSKLLLPSAIASLLEVNINTYKVICSW